MKNMKKNIQKILENSSSIIMQGIVMAVIWLLLAKKIVLYFFMRIPHQIASGISKSTGSPEKMGISTLEYILYLPFGALWEEVVFRLMPSLLCMLVIFIAAILGILDHTNSKLWKQMFLSTIILSSIIFGYLHGNIINIFIQGVGGLIFFWVWIKSFREVKFLGVGRGIIFATIASSMTHLLTNLILILIPI